MPESILNYIKLYRRIPKKKIPILFQLNTLSNTSILGLFQNLLAIDGRIKVYCFTILGGIGHTTYFHVDEKVLSLMCMIRKLNFEVNKTDQIKLFVCWMENRAST